MATFIKVPNLFLISKKIIDIEGKEYALSLPINIPVDADTGLYHLIIEATDAEGNEAEFIELDLEIHEH